MPIRFEASPLHQCAGFVCPANTTETVTSRLGHLGTQLEVHCKLTSFDSIKMVYAAEGKIHIGDTRNGAQT